MQKAKELHYYKKFIENLQTLIKPYIQALHLEWSVEFYLPELHEMPGLNVNLEKKEHGIFLDPYYVVTGDKYLGILGHLLCRARLAEINNPLFATMKVRIEPGDPDVSRKLDEFAIAVGHIELWGYDFRNSLFPGLSHKDYDWFIVQLKLLQTPLVAMISGFVPIRRYVSQQESLIGIMSAALQQALALRYNIPTENIADFMAYFWSPPALENLVKWIRYYQKLPHLTGNIDTDSKMLQQTVNEVASALQLSIRPVIYKMERGQFAHDTYFWTL